MVLVLLSARRFLPLFVTQFLGALNDNLFKNAMVVLLLWRAGDAGPVLVAVAGGVFILPYALFSGLAGELADRTDMSRLIRLIKLFEIALMALGAVGLALADPWLLMAVLFGFGVHSTFFGPMKYAILPVHLAQGELVIGNGLVEAGTFVAILIGTIVGGGLILAPSGLWLVTAAGLLVACAGYAAACAIPTVAVGAPGLKLDANLWRGTVDILRIARANRPVWQAILAISWFWTMGATVLSQFPVLAKDVLGADSFVVTLFLAVFCWRRGCCRGRRRCAMCPGRRWACRSSSAISSPPALAPCLPMFRRSWRRRRAGGSWATCSACRYAAAPSRCRSMRACRPCPARRCGPA